MKTSLILSILLFQLISITSNNNNIHYGNRNSTGVLYQQQRNNLISTAYSSPENLVLQINPDYSGIMMAIGNQVCQAFQSIVFIPDPSHPGSTISCPLNYFQENASLAEGWILNDSNEKIQIPNSVNFQKIIVTKKINQKEVKVELSDINSRRLLKYFELDVYHNLNFYKDFDCYAFISFITNVKYYPPNPEFEYLKKTPKVADIVAIAMNNKIPESIVHWALCLGDDLYLSKFGKSGRGPQAFVECMDLQSMMKLYNCNSLFVAVPKADAKPWDGFNLR